MLGHPLVFLFLKMKLSYLLHAYTVSLGVTLIISVGKVLEFESLRRFYSSKNIVFLHDVPTECNKKTLDNF